MNSYGKLSTAFYDLDKPYPPPDALEFYLQFARSADGQILEPMCGSGRYLIPIMQAGFDVTGVDASFSMLSACRSRGLQFGLSPNLVLQYLHQMTLPGVFKFAMVPEGSICLLTDLVEVRQALRNVFLSLKPGAFFVVEIEQKLAESSTTTAIGERSVQLPDGSQIVLRSSGKWDSSGEVMKGSNDYDLIRDGQIVESEWEQFDLRYYHPEAFSDLLSNAGFDNIRYHSPYDPLQAEAQSESLVFICTRP